jgi:RPA family protein
MTSTVTTVRRHRGRALALAVVAALTLAACGSSDSDSGSKSTTTTEQRASKKVADATCSAAIQAGTEASDSMRGLVQEHVDAFQAAIAGIEAYTNDDQATFTAKAAEFRAYAASEPAQTKRIDTAKQNAERAMKSCRDAQGGDPMSASCERAVTANTAEQGHLLDMLGAADALYASAEKAIASIEAGNATAAEAAMSEMSQAVSTWEATVADDDARYNAVEDALAACDLTTPKAESMG